MMNIYLIIFSFSLMSCSNSRQISMNSYNPSAGRFSASKQQFRTVTFHNRMNMFDMANKLEKEKLMDRDDFLDTVMNDQVAFLLLRKKVESLEGYLYPGTYRIVRNMNAADLAETMVERFLDVYASLTAYSNPEWSRHQMVTLASMIEKEALKDSEKPVISSVFHNRLRIGMKLQSDPTVYYGILRKTGALHKKVGRSGFKMDTIYNTYTREGFPVGPISNPDYESLKSVFYPKKTNYLYFVSRNNGTHSFNTNFKAHLRDVNYYQRR